MKITLRRTSLLGRASLALALCLGAASALAGTVTVKLTDSQGNPVSGGTVRTYYEGDKGSTGPDGTLTFSDARTTDSVYLKWGNHEVQWANQSISLNPTLTARTTKVTVDLKSCTTGLSLANTPDQWSLLPTFKAYYSGPIVGGSIEILPGTETFYVDWETHEVSMPGIVIGDGGVNHNGVIGNGATQPVTFFTTKVTLAGSNITYRNNSPHAGWLAFSSPMEMLPGNWEFTINGVQQTLPVSGCQYPPPAPEIVLYDGVDMVSGTELVDGQATPVNFSSVPLGHSAQQQFTLYNIGDAVLTIGSVLVGGANPGDFSVSGMPGSVQPGAWATFTVTFTPTAIGGRSATLSISDNDSNENPFDFPVTGTGISANTAPTVTCSTGGTLDCAPSAGLPVTVSANVTDPDSNQTLTVTLKQGDTLLDTQTISTPANGALVTFNAVTMLPGTHPLTIEVSDGSTSASCGTTVTVNADTTKPVITLNGANPMTVECHSAFTDPGATANDTCAGSFAATPSGTVDPNTPGTYTLTYTASDPSGHAAVPVTRTVNVVDTTKPVITLNGANPMTVECHGAFTDPGATANDTCAGSFAATASGTVDPNTPGTYTLTYSASDPSGNASEPVTRTVNVVDTTKPVITLNGVSPMTVECHASFTDPGATANDACAGSFAATASGTVDPNTPGTYTLTYRASDPSGNAGEPVTRTVNVVDTTKPVITLNGVSPMTVECHTSFTDPGATANDACAGSFAATASGTVDPNTPGTYTLTYRASDPSGNAGEPVTRTVNVLDTTKPVITLNGVSPMTVECHASFTDPGATANDACAGSFAATASGTVDPNTPGTYTLTYRASDPSGNAGEPVTRTVNVLDTTKPVITLNGVSPMTVECHTSFTDPGATANDACAGSFAATASGTVDPNTPGTYTLTYRASDPSGNAGEPVTRTVNVVDTTKPVITLNGPATLTLECHVGTYTEPGATVADACDTALTAATVGGQAVNLTAPGTYVVTYDAKDASGNAAIQVTRTVKVVDTTAPVITCPADITVNNDLGKSSAVVSYTAPVGTDNCPGATTAQTAGLPSGSAFPVGTTVNTFKVTDAAGLTAQCSFSVTVQDAEPPKITAPADITVNNGLGKSLTVVTYTAPVGTDNCPGATTVQTAGLPSGSAFPVGTTVNTFKVTDAAGLTALCSFRVTVNDTEKPTILCPADLVMVSDRPTCKGPQDDADDDDRDCDHQSGRRRDEGADHNGCGGNHGFGDDGGHGYLCRFWTRCLATGVVLTPPVVSDNCGIASVVNNHPSTTYPFGVTLVTWTVTDTAGNVATCVQKVTVVASVQVSFDSPLVRKPTCNSIRRGQVVPFKVDLDNCLGQSVKSGVTVTLQVQGIDASTDTVFQDVVEDASGMGVDGTLTSDALMQYRGGDWQFNLDTSNFGDPNTVAGSRYYRATVTVVDNATLSVLGVGSVKLETSKK